MKTRTILSFLLDYPLHREAQIARKLLRRVSVARKAVKTFLCENPDRMVVLRLLWDKIESSVRRAADEEEAYRVQQRKPKGKKEEEEGSSGPLADIEESWRAVNAEVRK